MFIIVFTSVSEGEVWTQVESTGHKTYREAQTKCREILNERVEEYGEPREDYTDTTDNPQNACIYLDSHGEGEDSMYKILEV